MKVHLLFQDREAPSDQEVPANGDTLTEDLQIDPLLDAMARGDPFLRQVSQRTLLVSLTDLRAIAYRQEVLEDCCRSPHLVRRIYSLAVEAIEKEKAIWGYGLDSPEYVLRNAVRVIAAYVEVLRRLRTLVESEGGAARSSGLSRLFASLRNELGEDYLREVETHLQRLRLEEGVLLSTNLGRGNKAQRYLPRTPRRGRNGWLRRLLRRRGTHVIIIDPRDQGGMKHLGEIRDRGINTVANALAQSRDHIKAFVLTLRTELGFYVACLNLRETLTEGRHPTCLPRITAAGTRLLTAKSLYDPSLALTTHREIVSNTLEGDGKALIVVTGANQGGKTTFLRSLGLAGLMAQSGMFVAAEELVWGTCTGVFTHFKREEDPTMTRGKFDEELSRVRAVTDQVRPHGLLLCNESFSSTTEREGSEIARQVLRACVEADIRVVFVTFLYDLAGGLCQEKRPDYLFLRAERRPDGRRTFKLAEGNPLPTSYGEDLYHRVFGTRLKTLPASPLPS